MPIEKARIDETRSLDPTRLPSLETRRRLWITFGSRTFSRFEDAALANLASPPRSGYQVATQHRTVAVCL